jgi:hypothetical protein
MELRAEVSRASIARWRSFAATLFTPRRQRNMVYGAPDKTLRMKRIHPNPRHALLATGVLAICFAGCQNQQTALSNPFMAPDRVPPPATRVVAPGAAQPYYPGDPLPPTHAASAPAAPVIAAAAAPASKAAPTTASPAGLAFSNERTVSIPSDESSMRFSLPPTPPPSAVAAAQPASSQGGPTALAAQPSAMQFQVVPASYTSANPSRVTLASATDVAANSPWRSPQVPANTAAAPRPINSPPMLAVVSAQAAPQIAGPQMPVTLRAVPSPTTEAAISQPPRIRFPSYSSTNQIVTTPGGPVQPAVFAAQQSMPQTIPITELSSTGTVPGLGPATMPSMSVASQPQTPAATVVSPDGFRARGSLH